MKTFVAILLALAAPPLIALRWDGRKLFLLRQRAITEGVDPAPARTGAYLARAWPSFAALTIGIFLTIGVSRRLDLPPAEAVAALLPFALGAAFWQHRMVAAIERDMFGER